MITVIESIPQDGESIISVEIITDSHVIHYNCIPTEIMIYIFIDDLKFLSFLKERYNYQPIYRLNFMRFDFDIISRKMRILD